MNACCVVLVKCVLEVQGIMRECRAVAVLGLRGMHGIFGSRGL